MKSLANGLLKVAEGVLKDYLLAYPDDITDVVRDKERLTRLTEERGLGVFTLDLPALDSILLRGLENSRLVLEGALSKRASAKTQVPRLFRGLWIRIFDRYGNLLEDADPTALFLLRQLLCLGKKVEVGCTPARTKQALKEYYHVEQAARLPTFGWSNDDLGSDDSCSFDDLFDHLTTSGGGEQLELWSKPDSGDLTHADRAILRRCQQNFDIFSQAIGTFGIEEFLSSIRANSNGIGFRHGPGAVSDLTHKEHKYDFPTWSEKLGATFCYRKYGTLSLGLDVGLGEDLQSLHPTAPLWFGQDNRPATETDEGSAKMVSHVPGTPGRRGEPIRFTSEEVIAGGAGIDPLDRTSHNAKHPSIHEPPSRLLAVPKTAKGPRLIAAEPTAHQWCQQFIKRFLEERLIGLFGTNFVSFKNQGLSQELVSIASLDRSLATVDLSSASDRLTCWVVERAFRRNQTLLRALHATRTRWTMDRVEKHSPPNYFVSKKFASQGTAVTFPIQSIIFLIIALTASGFCAKRPEDFFCNGRFYSPLARMSNKVRVFGDDIIVPKHGYERLCRLLHLLGLKVNQDKSFVKGSFRESCGMDAFKGYNVTPVKTKCIVATGPQSRQSLIDYANNLHQVGLWHAAEVVESMLPGWVRKNLPVVGIGCGGAGRFSYTGTSHSHLRKRYCDKLHRYEYRQYAHTARTKRIPTNTLGGVLQYFSEAPEPTTKWEHGIHTRPKTSDGLRWRPPYALP
nr:MAG: hypothetical protein 3 [Leviviridae sp.]